MTIYDEYKKIYQTIQQLGYLLIKKLNKCEVEKSDNLSFDQLITAIEEVKTKPYINNNNIKPTNKPELIIDKSLADFNKSLAKRIGHIDDESVIHKINDALGVSFGLEN